MKIKKNLNIEYMRAIACLGVILIHIMKSAHDVFDNMTPEIYFICTSFVNNLRWCVPVFLMISGYLLLDPEKKIGLIKIKQYIIRIVIVLGIFGTGFAFIELISKKHSVCFTFIFRAFVNMLMGKLYMSSRKINKLGWYAKVDLNEAYVRLCAYLKECEGETLC